MEVGVTCGCGMKLEVDAGAGVGTVACPRCQAQVPVPSAAKSPDSEIKIVDETPPAPVVRSAPRPPARAPGRMAPSQRATVMQAEMVVYSQPSDSSPVVLRLRKGTQFFLGEVVQAEGREWVRIRTIAMREGYIEGNTKIQVNQQTEEADGGFFAPERAGIRKGVVGGVIMIVIAAVWFFVGLAAGRIFFYPPILFIMGIYAIIKGLATGNLAGK